MKPFAEPAGIAQYTGQVAVLMHRLKGGRG
jgi:hypothetical protein